MTSLDTALAVSWKQPCDNACLQFVSEFIYTNESLENSRVEQYTHLKRYYIIVFFIIPIFSI